VGFVCIVVKKHLIDFSWKSQGIRIMIFGGVIMTENRAKPQPMMAEQFEYVKKQIVKTYLFLISHTEHDPKVVEVMKLSALADVQKRYEAGEPW
jgi:hypothetical protein